MKYAIIESGGKQYRAVEGETIEVDRLPVEAGENIKLEQVLLLADGENFTVGTPLLENNPVWAKVLEHFKGPKVTIFNYRAKKRIRVKTGHRQSYTRLLVEQIGGSVLIPRKEPKKVIEAEAEEVEAEKATKKPTKTPSKAKSEPKKVSTASEVETKASSKTKASVKTETKTKTTKVTKIPVEAETQKKKKAPVKATAKAPAKKAPAKSSSSKKAKKTPKKKAEK